MKALSSLASPLWGEAARSASLVILALLGSACTTIRSPAPVPTVVAAPFSHHHLDRVLRRFVDDHGLVAYAALARDRRDLDRYYARIAAVSPDSHPALFPDEASRLAYWINAYNATVLVAVLGHYPITSVADVKPPIVWPFLPSKSGFFLFQRVTFGGATTNLWSLENRVIRERFPDPRVHFALNCASLGCPRLPREAFVGERLEEQLAREARRFLGEARNLEIDAEAEVVRLSAIFDWYEEDFLAALPGTRPASTGLLRAVAEYAADEQRGPLAAAADYRLEFVAYDWRLNDARRAHGLE